MLGETKSVELSLRDFEAAASQSAESDSINEYSAEESDLGLDAEESLFAAESFAGDKLEQEYQRGKQQEDAIKDTINKCRKIPFKLAYKYSEPWEILCGRYIAAQKHAAKHSDSAGGTEGDAGEDATLNVPKHSFHIPSFCPTRWNSLYDLLDSVHDNRTLL